MLPMTWNLNVDVRCARPRATFVAGTETERKSRRAAKLYSSSTYSRTLNFLAYNIYCYTVETLRSFLKFKPWLYALIRRPKLLAM